MYIYIHIYIYIYMYICIYIYICVYVYSQGPAHLCLCRYVIICSRKAESDIYQWLFGLCANCLLVISSWLHHYVLLFILISRSEAAIGCDMCVGRVSWAIIMHLQSPTCVLCMFFCWEHVTSHGLFALYVASAMAIPSFASCSQVQ